MPLGVSWGQYLRFLTAAMVFTLAGAQMVHSYYKPLQNLDSLVEEELERRRKTENG